MQRFQGQPDTCPARIRNEFSDTTAGLIARGPGRFSLDHVLGWDRRAVS